MQIRTRLPSTLPRSGEYVLQPHWFTCLPTATAPTIDSAVTQQRATASSPSTTNWIDANQVSMDPVVALLQLTRWVYATGINFESVAQLTVSRLLKIRYDLVIEL